MNCSSRQRGGACGWPGAWCRSAVAGQGTSGRVCALRTPLMPPPRSQRARLWPDRPTAAQSAAGWHTQKPCCVMPRRAARPSQERAWHCQLPARTAARVRRWCAKPAPAHRRTGRVRPTTGARGRSTGRRTRTYFPMDRRASRMIPGGRPAGHGERPITVMISQPGDAPRSTTSGTFDTMKVQPLNRKGN